MFGRLQFYIFIGILVFGSLTAGYYTWRMGVIREALLEYNQKQLEQTVKDNEDYQRKLKEIQDNQDAIIQKNEEDKKNFELKMKNVNDYLDTNDVKKLDRPASEVLKKTVTILKDAPK